MTTEPTTTNAPALASPREAPQAAYRSALRRYEPARLVAILQALGVADRPSKAGALADAIADRLAEPRAAGDVIAGLAVGPRAALGVFGLTECPRWPAVGLAQTLGLLGIEAAPAIGELLRLGLLAAQSQPERPEKFDLAPVLAGTLPEDLELIAHPEAMAAARTVLPEGEGPPRISLVRQVREADGLEPILRLAALWQRVDEIPLRQTQQGVLYKRDRDRLEDDPVLAGPIADAFEPLPDMVPLWLALARGIGLVLDEPGSDRLVAAPADFWAEHAVHLPQMIATRWLALRTWHEQAGAQGDGASALLALPFARPAVLLWLARCGAGEWIALDDLAAFLDGLQPGWDRPALAGADLPPIAPPSKPARARGEAPARETARDRSTGVLTAMLLGPAYQLGLVRAAEESPSGRRVVQLTPLGRYVQALGPPPPPRPTFEHFLYVQPNFEIIAYRQGLTPAVIGPLSQFTRWVQIGAALELKLTPESVYRGLEGGLTPESILDRLGRHSARPLPSSVAEAVRTWSGRRERVSYYVAATLIEFATAADLEAALASWPSQEGQGLPVRVSDRLLLVEDDQTIPYHRFRLTGSRDYRRSPEACVEIEPDGITLALDLGRSDLFVDAELARFADELPQGGAREPAAPPRRRYRASPSSIARAFADGLTPAQLARWFAQRTGADLPPAIRLLIDANSPGLAPLRADRPLILMTPTPDLLNGLTQHPATRDLLGDRLGPTAVIIPDAAADRLRQALAGLGLSLMLPE